MLIPDKVGGVYTEAGVDDEVGVVAIGLFSPIFSSAVLEPASKKHLGGSEGRRSARSTVWQFGC